MNVFFLEPAAKKGDLAQEGEMINFSQKVINMDDNDDQTIKVVNKGCHCLDCWVLLLVLAVMVLIMLPLGIVLGGGLFAVMLLLCIVRIIVVCCTDTRKFLKALNLDINPYDYTEHMQSVNPYTEWTINCYHFETRFRTVTYRDSNGNSHQRIESY